jgi:hypothetical protein
MARDFSIRPDLLRLGVPERTIRVLEKAAELTQLIQDSADLQAATAALDTTVTALDGTVAAADAAIVALDARIDAYDALAPFVRQDQTSAWVDATGTPSRATFATYAGQTISASPTQVEVQAIDDHVKVLSQRVAALINDLRAISALT